MDGRGEDRLKFNHQDLSQMAIPLTLSNVPDEIPYIQYVAANEQTVYPYPFPITQDSDLIVVINGVTQGTDSTYSLSGQGNNTGGNVTLNSGSEAGDVVTLYRDIQIERLTQFAQNGGFSSTAFNAEFNNLYLIAQQLEASIEQSLRIPNTNNPAPVTTLTPGAYAGKYLAFDSNGNPTPAVLTSTGAITAGIIGGLIYPATSAEETTGIALNLAYRYGSFQRYGMDPTGTNDSTGNLAAAIACNDHVFDEYPGGGNYIFNSTVAPTRYPIHIQGTSKNIGGGTGGTRFTLQSGAGSNAALLHWESFVADFEVDHIAFGFQSSTSGQVAVLFDEDARSIRIHDNAVSGAGSSTTTVTAFKLAGGGTFSGDVTIEDNYITGVATGVALAGACSTIRVLNNEMYTNPAVPNSTGVLNNSNVGGLIVEGNTFESWNKGIYAPNGGTRQKFNYFEGSLADDFDWGTSRNNISLGDICTGTPSSSFLINNSTNNVVMGGDYGDVIDSGAMSAFRGFIEQNRTAANGHQITRAFSADNYFGSGSMSWTVTSGETGADVLVVNGNEATYYFSVTNSTVGGSVATALEINLASFGFTAAFDSYAACSVVDNGGTAAVGIVRITENGQVIQIFKDGTTAANWSASTTATTVRGHIKFPIDFSVN